MAYIPPLNGGRLNASIGGNSTSAGAGYALLSTGTMLLAGGNNITLSQNGGNITISGGVGGGVALANSNTTVSSGTANLSVAGGAMTISGTNQTFNFSVPQLSSLVATGAISISSNGNTVSIGAPAMFDAGVSTIGNTAGITGQNTNGLVLAGGSNITLSQSTDSNGATVNINAQSQSNQIMSMFAAGNTTQNTSATIDARSLTFNGLGGVSVGYSNGSVQISGGAGGGGGLALANSQTTYSSGTANLNVAGGAMTIASTTGQSFNFSVPQTSSLAATGAVSISTNGGTISIGAPIFNFAISSNTSGTGGTVSNGLILAGGSNVTLSQSTNSNGATVTINGGAGGGGGVALYDGVNSISSGTASLQAGGALSISVNNQTLSFSVPATSIMSATGAVSLSTNGGTISIGAPQNGTVSNWEPNLLQGISLTNATLGSNYAPASFFKLQPMAYVNASQLAQLVSFDFATNTSVAGSITLGAGIYTATGSTLSLITQSSGTVSYTLANSSTSSTASYMGIRALSMPLGVAMTPGNYWIGMWSRTSANVASLTAYNMLGGNNSNLTFSGSFGQAGAASVGVQEGVGLFATSTAGLPTSAAMSAITQSGWSSNLMPYLAFKNRTW